jgi:hypothetical protein
MEQVYVSSVLVILMLYTYACTCTPFGKPTVRLVNSSATLLSLVCRPLIEQVEKLVTREPRLLSLR